MNKEICALSW